MSNLLELNRGDFVKVNTNAKTSLILPHHNTSTAEKWRNKDLEKYDYVGLVCKVNDYNKEDIVVCLSFGAEIHWYPISSLTKL
jgi:hypothetical protein